MGNHPGLFLGRNITLRKKRLKMSDLPLTTRISAGSLNQTA
jgi:hypothetical protein